MSDVSERLRRLMDAVQEFAQEDNPDKSIIVNGAVLVYERISYNDDGSTTHCIEYSCPTEIINMSSALGLIEAGGEFIRRDILGLRTDAQRDDDA